MTDAVTKPVVDLVPPQKLPYMRGIDGLRAIAVMAVLFYHANFAWAEGGFLGVEVFFVISGYLITSLLLIEWLRTDTIALKAFWIDGQSAEESLALGSAAGMTRLEPVVREHLGLGDE